MPEVPIIHFLKPPWGAAKNLFKQININQMFDKIQINLMTKTRCSNNFLRGKLPRGHLPPRIIAPVENWHPEKLPPTWLPPDYCFRTITPKIIAFWQYPPWKFSPRRIAFRMICPVHNCPEKNCPPPPSRKIHAIYFSQDSEIVVLLSIVASSWFPSLWFKLVLDLHFCMEKSL